MCDWHMCRLCCAAVGMALSLHWDMLASDLIICLAWPHWSWGFFFFWQNLVRRGGDLHLMMSVILRSCAWKYHLLCFKCHLSGTLFSMCFTCSMHTHPFSETCAIALAIGFSSESVLKYERLKQQKKLVRVLGWFLFKWFFY